MNGLLMVLGPAVGLGLGVWIGLAAGRRVTPNRWRFFALNVAALVAGGLICAYGLSRDQVPLALAGVGLTAGSMTGLKYGYTDFFGMREVPKPAAVEESDGSGQ